MSELASDEGKKKDSEMMASLRRCLYEKRVEKNPWDG